MPLCWFCHEAAHLKFHYGRILDRILDSGTFSKLWGEESRLVISQNYKHVMQRFGGIESIKKIIRRGPVIIVQI